MAALRPARASVLVVEDDPVVTRALMDSLELADYRVWHAVSGVDARGQIQRANPDLILLDLWPSFRYAAWATGSPPTLRRLRPLEGFC